MLFPTEEHEVVVLRSAEPWYLTSRLPDMNSEVFDSLLHALGLELHPICRTFFHDATIFIDSVSADQKDLDFARAAEIAHRHHGAALSLGFNEVAQGFASLENSYRCHQLAEEQAIPRLRLLLEQLSIEVEDRFKTG